MGIVRTTRRLEYAAQRIALLEREVRGYYARFQISRPLLEMRNLARVAGLMVESAQGRKESRGLHFNSDYPDTSPLIWDSILIPQNFDRHTALDGAIDQLPEYAS